MSQNALQQARSSRDRSTIGQENGASILNAFRKQAVVQLAIEKNASRGKDSGTLYDLDRALLEAAKELDFDWPEFLPVERVIRGITEIALGCALVAGVAVLWCFVWSDF